MLLAFVPTPSTLCTTRIFEAVHTDAHATYIVFFMKAKNHWICFDFYCEARAPWYGESVHYMIFQESLWMHIYQRRGRQQRMRNSFDRCTDDLISTIGRLRSIECWKIIGQHWKSMRSVNTDWEYFGQIDSLSILDQVLERKNYCILRVRIMGS